MRSGRGVVMYMGNVKASCGELLAVRLATPTSCSANRVVFIYKFCLFFVSR